MPSFPRVPYVIYRRRDDGTETQHHLTYSAAEALEMLQKDPTRIVAGATGRAMTLDELARDVSIQAKISR